MTCWRATTSVALSLNVTIRKDRPNWVCENTRTEFGVPASAVSIGIVTWRSTSSAARPGYSVMTLTWMSETSGKASIGRFLKAARPPPMKMARPSQTNSFWCSAK